MQGRLEHKLKIQNQISDLLQTLPSYVTDYYYSLSSQTDSARSWKAYILEVKNFISFVESKGKTFDPANIVRADIEQYFITKKTKVDYKGQIQNTSFEFRKRCYSLLKKFFDYLLDEDILSTNPMAKVKRPIGTDTVNRIHLTSEDEKKIIEAIDDMARNDIAASRQKQWLLRDKSILLLFMTTGIRCTALSEINVDDIDFTNNTITIIDKNYKTQYKQIPTQLTELLKSWIKDREEKLGNVQNDALFISNRRARMHPDSIANLVKKYSEIALDKSLSPHKLRAGYCTILYEQTHDLEFVRRAVGHSRIETTKIYAVDNLKAQEQSAEIMTNNLFG